MTVQIRTTWHVEGEDTLCTTEAVNEHGETVGRVTIRAEQMIADDFRSYTGSEAEQRVEQAAESLLEALVAHPPPT